MYPLFFVAAAASRKQATATACAESSLTEKGESAVIRLTNVDEALWVRHLVVIGSDGSSDVLISNVTRAGSASSVVDDVDERGQRSGPWIAMDVKCRCPNANAFLRLGRKKVDCLSKYPKNRWQIAVAANRPSHETVTSHESRVREL